MKCLFKYTLVVVLLAGFAMPVAGQEQMDETIPVIYDTDIADDIDDLWGLVFALKSPELDVKLVTTSRRNTRRRAKVVAKVLAMMGRHDVTVAAGTQKGNPTVRYQTWASDFDLSEFKGEFSTNGVEKIIQTVRSDRTGRLKIITVGIMTNVAAALEREPELAGEAELVAMSGHLKTGEEDVGSETNVKLGIDAAQKGYSAPWKRMTIAPLNVTSNFHLRGDLYRHIYESEKPAARAIIQAYRIFKPNAGWVDHEVSEASSTLHDTVAVGLAFTEKYVHVKKLPIRVTDNGITRIDRTNGRPVHVALGWKNRKRFEKLLVKRITGSLPTEE